MVARKKTAARKAGARRPVAKVPAGKKAAAKSASTAAKSARPRRSAKVQAPRISRASPGTGPVTAARELIIIPAAAAEAVAAPAVANAMAPAVAVAVAASRGAEAIKRILRRVGGSARPLFSTGLLQPSPLPAAPAMAAAVAASAPPAALGSYQAVDAPDEALDDIAADLLARNLVAAAYVKPAVEPPLAPPTGRGRQRRAAAAAVATPAAMLASATGDFSPMQGYLNSAPGGVDARFAWTQPGGKGEQINVIDIEGAWRFDHEDLGQNQGGVVGGTPFDDLDWRNHGTAVISEIGADENGIGVIGIAPASQVSAVSHNGPGTAGAILKAARKLGPGDLLLLEMHRPGPRHNFQERRDQLGYIAIEWWSDDFDAIQVAVRRGVVVIEAAGNGAENLDDALYNRRPAGFPGSWRNPFDRANRDSGAVVVGAGAPPSGAFGPDRSRLDFSNFGALVDAQGWGRQVVACGYGFLQGGNDENLWYTHDFSGTSSASPIVTGALACVQGVRRAMGRTLLTPAQSRTLLRTTGSPQQAGPNGPATQRIGNRPDIRNMVQQMP